MKSYVIIAGGPGELNSSVIAVYTDLYRAQKAWEQITSSAKILSVRCEVWENSAIVDTWFDKLSAPGLKNKTYIRNQDDQVVDKDMPAFWIGLITGFCISLWISAFWFMQ